LNSYFSVSFFSIEAFLQSALVDFPAIDEETKEETINRYANLLRKEKLHLKNTLNELDESTLRGLGIPIGHARAISRAVVKKGFFLIYLFLLCNSIYKFQFEVFLKLIYNDI
jgi:hypothetical protein